jgi:predicted nucleotidyltransferase
MLGKGRNEADVIAERCGMQRDAILRVLSSHQARLREMGVKSLALFGSVARGQAAEGSDVDLLVEFDRPVGYFHFLDVKEYLEGVLGGAKVDLVVRGAVFDELKEDIYAVVHDPSAHPVP